MGDFYGRSHLFALKSEQGFLCHSWLDTNYMGVVLFTDTKTANAWLKEVTKYGFAFEVRPTIVKEHPTELKPTINPGSDRMDIHRILGRVVWQNW